ncbi:MAG TPA: TlpA disulfide reductase family protein [Phnomibacter sp.]|nr:TlpA disulfide reductase family protein [Phnomibacter sp.]
MKNIFSVLLGLICFVSGVRSQDIRVVKAPELLDLYKSEKGVVIINFWSTWCKPCVEEIPHFIRVFQELKPRGVSLWLVSQDTRSLYHTGKLQEYIKNKKGWTKAQLFWFDETDADHYCPLIDKDWSGVIPATLIVNPTKGYRKFIEESMSAGQLKAEVELAL